MQGGAVGHNMKGDHPRIIPVKFAFIWFSGFRWGDLNVIFHQNMPNLHNRYKSAERKMSHNKTGIYIKLCPCHVAAVKI